MNRGAQGRNSRHPKLLWAAAVSLLVIWIATFWVYLGVTNWDSYVGRLANGGASIQCETRRGLLGGWGDLRSLFPKAEIFDHDVAGQHVRLGWIRGNRPTEDSYHWTEGLGGWPAIAHIDNTALGGRWAVRIPLWLPLLIIALLIWRWYRRHRPRPGTCRNCGYDLTGNISGRCPECGTRISQAQAVERATE